MSEKAAWEYIESLNHKDRFILVVLNPTYLVGPTLTGLFFTSGGITIKKLMNNFGTGKFPMPLSDVRDCAQAHILSLTSEEIKKS
jgi:nucleoside-diphosphate-sugar epimerase